jgi:catechol 2,3-dioxygenase-like lactoylglutathione lyase family enzyme
MTRRRHEELTMKIDKTLAAVAVREIDTAIDWYANLLGRRYDDRPMSEAAEWRLADGGGIQLVLDQERAGRSMVTLGVRNLDDVVSDLASRGVVVQATAPGSGPFRLAQLRDPDGNLLTFSQDQRI